MPFVEPKSCISPNFFGPNIFPDQKSFWASTPFTASLSFLHFCQGKVFAAPQNHILSIYQIYFIFLQCVVLEVKVFLSFKSFVKVCPSTNFLSLTVTSFNQQCQPKYLQYLATTLIITTQWRPQEDFFPSIDLFSHEEPSLFVLNF